MKPVRIGIIGVGNMGKFHVSYLRAGNIPEAQLTALCDIDAEAMAACGDLPRFTDSAELIGSGLVDAVIIATPHFAHTTVGSAALKAGLHVLVEKPISVHKADCERLIAAHQGKKQVFGAMFNQRTNPLYQKVRQLISDGELGPLLRVTWLITDWFRTQAYYDSGGWRATWAGEGGGVLTNQCTHQLDLLQWLTGMPVNMHAICGFGQRHKIEVEDQVTATFEYANGAVGTLITTTGETPGVNRLEIVGERGRLLVECGKLRFFRNEMPAVDFIRGAANSYDTPTHWAIDIPTAEQPRQHETITRNFVQAICNGTPLLAPAREGIHAVELANAMLLSAWLGRTVALPLDAKKYARELQKRVRTSRYTGDATSHKREMVRAPWMGKG